MFQNVQVRPLVRAQQAAISLQGDGDLPDLGCSQRVLDTPVSNSPMQAAVDPRQPFSCPICVFEERTFRSCGRSTPLAFAGAVN